MFGLFLMINFVCWLWRSQNRTPYNPSHVNALSRMLKDHVKQDHRLICITDLPVEVECEKFPLWDDKDFPRHRGCYKRLKLFDPEISEQIGGRIFSLDLDIVIKDDISKLIDEEEDFQGMKGTVSHVNGSAWTFKAGTCHEIWECFLKYNGHKPPKNKVGHHGTDQSIISYAKEKCPTWNGNDDGVWAYKTLRRLNKIVDDWKLVAFPGGQNPWDNCDASFMFQQLRNQYLRYL